MTTCTSSQRDRAARRMRSRPAPPPLPRSHSEEQDMTTLFRAALRALLPTLALRVLPGGGRQR
jgi:hypothetical protein